MSPQSAADYYNQLQGLTKELERYTPIDANEVKNSLLQKVDNFKPLYTDLRNAEANAYSAPARVMAEYESMYGNSPTQGPGGFQRLNTSMGQVARDFARAGVMGDIINTQGGRITDLANSVVNQYNNSRQGILDRYNMITPLWQSALQQEEAARQRAAIEAQTRAYNSMASASRVQQRQQQQTPTSLNNNGSKLAIGTEVGDMVVIGYDAQGNPILEQKKLEQKKAGLGETLYKIYVEGAPLALNPFSEDNMRVFGDAINYAQKQNQNWYDWINPVKGVQNSWNFWVGGER